MRGKGVSLATSANWAFNTALGEFVPVAFTNIAWKTYLIFGVFNIAMLIHVFFMFPETAGRPLEEVNEIFDKKIPAWKTGNSWSRTKRAERGDLEDATLSRHTSDGDVGAGAVTEKAKVQEREDIGVKA